MAGTGARGQTPRRGGRKKGVKNRVTTVLKEAILEALDRKGGVDYLATLAVEEPRAFAGLLGRLVPNEVKAQLETEQPLRIQVVSGISADAPGKSADG